MALGVPGHGWRVRKASGTWRLALVTRLRLNFVLDEAECRCAYWAPRGLGQVSGSQNNPGLARWALSAARKLHPLFAGVPWLIFGEPSGVYLVRVRVQLEQRAPNGRN